MENQSAKSITQIINRFVCECRKSHNDFSTLGNIAKKHIIATSRGFANWTDFEASSNRSAFTGVLTTHYGQTLSDAYKAFDSLDNILFRSGETAEWVAHDYCFNNDLPLTSIQALNEESNEELEVFLNSKGYAFCKRIRDASDGNAHFWTNPRISDSHSDGKQFGSHRENLMAAYADYKADFECLDFAEKEKALSIAHSIAMRQANSHDDALRDLYLAKYDFFSGDSWNLDDLSFAINKLNPESKFKKELEALWDSI